MKHNLSKENRIQIALGLKTAYLIRLTGKIDERYKDLFQVDSIVVAASRRITAMQLFVNVEYAKYKKDKSRRPRFNKREFHGMYWLRYQMWEL